MAEVVTNPQPWARDVTRDAIRHFAWGVGDNNPLWLDSDHGLNSRWGGILAPPCFAYAVHETTVAPGFEGCQRIYTAVDWHWFDVIRPGTELFANSGFRGLSACLQEKARGRKDEKTGRRNGRVTASQPAPTPKKGASSNWAGCRQARLCRTNQRRPPRRLT